jgi:zinc transport system ATP-binding protein
MQKTDMVYCINRHICCFGKPEDIHQHPEYLLLFEDAESRENAKEQISFYSHRHNHRH